MIGAGGGVGKEVEWVLKKKVRTSALLSLSCYFLSIRELARLLLHSLGIEKENNAVQTLRN